MGYIVEGALDCEGYVSQLFADGERGSTTSGQGVNVWPGGDIEREETRPYADVVAWRVDCACGWAGSVHPLASERAEDVESRWSEPTEAREDALMNEWRRHVAPFTRTARVRELAEQVSGLSDQLAGAVLIAKRDGASWSDLGRALGLSKQGAQQRYGDLI